MGMDEKSSVNDNVSWSNRKNYIRLSGKKNVSLMQSLFVDDKEPQSV
jgi:hypothetical protein